MNRSYFFAPCLLALASVSWVFPVEGADEQGAGAGAVYTMTNDVSGNVIWAYTRDEAGKLTLSAKYPTGGIGTGGFEPDSGLGNARSLVLNESGKLLFVVNPGSATVTVFDTSRGQLRAVGLPAPTGGAQPVSVTVSGHLVYVLNADNISGFTVSDSGSLTPIPHSTRPLSTTGSAPAEIRFNREGTVLAVTEKNTNVIDTWLIGRDGTPSASAVQTALAPLHPEPTNSPVFPFGFDFGMRSQLFLADDFFDTPGLGAITSFNVLNDGQLQPATNQMRVGQSGGCWVLVSKDGRYAYLSSTVSSAVSVLRIDANSAKLTLLGAVRTGLNPTDMDFSVDNRFLYVLVPDQTELGVHAGINVFEVSQKDGSLTLIQTISGLPTTVDGIAAR